MSIILNGESRELADSAKVSELLADLGLHKQPVLVEHNGTALHPREFSEVALAEGDKVELIRIVAGG